MDAIALTPQIHGAGTPEHVWAGSAQMRALPAALLQQLVPAECRLVVVAPHPDDEVLGAGGLMASAARHGRSVLVIAVTDGEKSHPECDGAFLARLRARERTRAMKSLGVPAGNTVRMKIPDGGVAHGRERLSEQLRTQLTARDVVAVPWSKDGHPDHDATSTVAQDAARAAGAVLLEFPVWGWHWAEPDEPLFPWHRGVLFRLDEDIGARKAHAIDAFTSQIRALGTRAPILATETLARFRRSYEVYFR